MRVVLAAVVVALAAPNVQAAEGPHWRQEGCDHGHPSRVAHKAVSRLSRNHRPLTAGTKRRVRHYVACVATRRKARAVQRHVLRLRAWRMSYRHRWPIVFNRLPSWDRAWAWSTGACESGNNPATNTGNGFEGAFQFVYSTWLAAGGTGHAYQHSWHYQAVIAVRWMHVAGAGQWPVCGR